MLAAWTDYLRAWHLLPVLALIVGWIVGGGYLLRRSMTKRQPQVKAKLSRATAAVLAAGSAGAFSGLIMFVLFRTIGQRLAVPLEVVGLVVGLVVLLVIAYLVLYAMLALSAKETLLTALPAMAGVLLLTAVIGVATGIPTKANEDERRAVRNATLRMREIGRVLADKYLPDRTRTARRVEPLPETLESLFSPVVLRYGEGEGKPRYFYLRPASKEMSPGSKALIVCEIQSQHSGRAILFADGEARWVTEEEFRGFLKAKENEAFAKAFQVAGK